MRIEIPEKVCEAMRALKQAEVESWVIGGAVRDSLLERPVHDWDLTVACTPERLAEALPDAKPIGGVFGTVSWHGVEITPCRAESSYSDHRHPDRVEFGTDLRADLSRRDFTVNAMAFDGEVVTDPFHGRYDVCDRVLRCVGDPAVRFEEDALRILRLYRFAGTLGFGVEEATGREALRRAETLATVSAQRVRNELVKALAGPCPSALAPLLAAGGLAAFALPGEEEWPKSLQAQPPAQAKPEGPNAQGEAPAQAAPDGSEAHAQAVNRLAALDTVPAVPLLRWWALLRLTGAQMERAAKVFDFSRLFVRQLEQLDDWFCGGMPADRHALKLRLSEPLPFAFDMAAQAFAALTPEFSALPAEYAALLESREPFTKEHLRITPAELLTEGVPGRKISAVQKCLVKTVIDTPALNVWPTLAGLAKQLRWMV